jgi:hypothetical protein
MDKEQIRIAVAKELGWTKDFVEGNGFDCDMWFHPISKMCYYYPTISLDSWDDCQEMLNNLKDEELHIFDKHLSEISEVGPLIYVLPFYKHEITPFPLNNID